MNPTPFPFLCYGYREKRLDYIHLLVRLKAAPDAAAQKTIRGMLPKVLRPYLRFYGRIMEFVKKNYKQTVFRKKVLAAYNCFPEDEETLYAAAAETLTMQFQDDMENWVYAVDAQHPVEIALRLYENDYWPSHYVLKYNEPLPAYFGPFEFDGNPEGQDRGITQAQELIYTWERDAHTWEQQGHERTLFVCFATYLFMIGRTTHYSVIPERFIYTFFATRELSALASSSPAKALAFYYKYRDINPGLEQWLCYSDYFMEHGISEEVLLAYMDLFLELPPREGFHDDMGVTLLMCILRAKRNDLIPQLLNVLSDKQILHSSLSFPANYICVGLMERKEFETARTFCTLLLNLDHDPAKVRSSSVYWNALWLLQYDNTKLPVDAAQNRRTISLSLNKARKDPSIYYLFVALYVEMNEFKIALRYLRKTIQSGIYEVPDYLNEMRTLPVFEQFRALPEVAELIAEKK